MRIKCFAVAHQTSLRRCFPCALDSGHSSNTFQRISAFFEHNFCLAPLGKSKLTRLIYFFHISLLNSLNLVLILGTEFDGHRGTWTGCIRTCYGSNEVKLQIESRNKQKEYPLERCVLSQAYFKIIKFRLTTKNVVKDSEILQWQKS